MCSAALLPAPVRPEAWTVTPRLFGVSPSYCISLPQIHNHNCHGATGRLLKRTSCCSCDRVDATAGPEATPSIHALDNSTHLQRCVSVHTLREPTHTIETWPLRRRCAGMMQADKGSLVCGSMQHLHCLHVQTSREGIVCVVWISHHTEMFLTVRTLP